MISDLNRDCQHESKDGRSECADLVRSGHLSTSSVMQKWREKEKRQSSNMTKRDLFFKSSATNDSSALSNNHVTVDGLKKEADKEEAARPMTNGVGSHGPPPASTGATTTGGPPQPPKERAPVVQPAYTDGSYVGFASLPNQVYRKSVKRGFEFTLMVVGESGLGKSTLINSLFLSDLYSNEYPGPSARLKKTTQVETTKVMLKENGVQLVLTVVDTPGFGDSVDNSNCWLPVVNHIESKYAEYLNAESRVNRKLIPDNRVHVCLYFIAPSGHGLKSLDVEFMKKLHDKVNIIPLIAKADTMTPEECAQFKKTIMYEINQNKIKIYDFPDVEDEDENKTNRMMKDRMPFAVVGSNTVIESQGKKVRGRRYPWGVVEVEAMEHCDFIPLRNMLIRTHMHDLKDVTNCVHYENYRYKKLVGIAQSVGTKGAADKSPFTQMEDEKKEHVLKMKKMEAEMEQVFEQKVKEKKMKLKDSEVDLQRRHEQMKKSLEQQQADLEDKIRQFEREKVAFDEAQDALKRTSLETTSKGPLFPTFKKDKHHHK